MLRAACTLSEYFRLPKESTYKNAHQIPSDRHLIFLVTIPESGGPWSRIPGHSRELAHGRLAFRVLIGLTAILLAFVNLRVIWYNPATWT